MRRGYLFSVAQIANLPHRRLQIGRALAVFRRPGQGAVLQDGILRYGRLAVCATNTTEALNRYRRGATLESAGRALRSPEVGLGNFRSPLRFFFISVAWLPLLRSPSRAP